MLNDDNDEARRAVEVCFRTRKTLVNPIIDWSDDEVWEFIRKYDVPYCELYDMGAERLGCIGCPMSGKKQIEEDFEKYPKYKEQYLRCLDVIYENRCKKGLQNMSKWESGEDIFNWWIGNSTGAKGQMSLLETEET